MRDLSSCWALSNTFIVQCWWPEARGQDSHNIINTGTGHRSAQRYVTVVVKCDPNIISHFPNIFLITLILGTHPLLVHFLSLAGRLLRGEVAEHVLDLGHVGHNVLHKHQGGRVVHLALALLPQDVLVATENIKSELDNFSFLINLPVAFVEGNFQYFL